jgi:hypothetical protein
MSAYRFHEGDRIFFKRSLDLRVDHGLYNTKEADMSSVAYWYQTEPHSPFPALPTESKRRTRTPWSNYAQWLVVAVLFAVFVELAIVSIR